MDPDSAQAPRKQNERGTTPRTRPSTLHDVAKLAGVSQATASRVLHGTDRKVDERYHELVSAAARELDYTPNASAQAIRNGQRNSIALIVGQVADAYFSSLTASMMHAAERRRMRVSLLASNRNVVREAQLVRELRGQRPRAIVLAGSSNQVAAGNDELEHELRAYESHGGRVVLISRTDLPFDTIAYDNFEGAKRLALEMHSLGYRRFRVVGTDAPLLSMQRRVDGFVAGLNEVGIRLDPAAVLRPSYSWEGIRRFVREVDEATIRDTDLIFGVTDEVALGTLAGLRDRGVRVPEDMAIAGFDDITTLRDVRPTMSTVHIPMDELAETVLRHIEEPGGTPPVSIPTSVLVRDSTPRVEVHER